MCLKSTFDSTTNNLSLSPMFQNYLLLDLTVIDIMSIVHMDEIWTGGGGVKKGQIFADVLYGWPLSRF